jgi:hypothetical protein
MRSKRGIVSDYLPWVLIAVVVLAIMVLAIITLKGNGASLIDKIKNLFSGI